MFKKVYSLYSAFCTQTAFYCQPALILPLVRSLQSAVRSLRFRLTGYKLSYFCSWHLTINSFFLQLPAFTCILMVGGNVAVLQLKL